jgi:hypothetical protein
LDAARRRSSIWEDVNGSLERRVDFTDALFIYYRDSLAFLNPVIWFSEITLQLLAEGKVQVDYLIQSQYDLSEGLAAFEWAQQRGVLKVLLAMS